jgi:hypothetical protein
MYRNCHGIFLKEQVWGGCNCSRKHWHVRLLSEVQKERREAERKDREEMKAINKANWLAMRRTLESGAFSLGL